MKRAWPKAALAAISLACLSEKAAMAAADVPLAVLGIEANEAPDALASSLTDALRQRVQQTKGYRLVPGRDLVEVKLVFSCPDEAPSCMAQAGKSLGATKLIFGSVKKSIGDSFLVTLKLLDANRGIVDAFVAEQIGKGQASGNAIKGPVQKWFATLTGQGGAGIIKVRSDVIGASVALDGNPSGVMGTDDLVLSGISPGKHEVTLSKSGYQSASKQISVGSGETATVDIKMGRAATPVAAAPPPPPAPTPVVAAAPVASTTPPARADEPPPHVRDTGTASSGNTTLKVATWATLGGSVVALALGVKYGLDVQSVNKDLDDYRRFPCAAGLCNGQGVMKPPLNQMEIEYVKLKKDDGQRLELYQYISYGVGGVLLLTSGYLFYRAYLDDSSEHAQGPSRRFALVPTVSPTGAGAAAFARF